MMVYKFDEETQQMQYVFMDEEELNALENEPTSAPGHLDANQGCSTTSVDDSNVITK